MAIHTITSLENPLVKRLVKLRVNSDFRHEQQSVVIEGLKPVQEVCAKHATKAIVVTDISLLPPGVHADDVFVINEKIMKKISGMQSSEGILAEVVMPKAASLKNCRAVIALDRVSDPANLGGLLRTALALGWDGAFILDNSCDLYNEKALRAARGATFRLPIATGSWAELKKLATENRWEPLVADLDGQDIRKYKKPSRPLLVLSNEAHGASEEACGFCTKISIPMPGEMESRNVSVAGGILMYEFAG